jgi:predicted nucleic acid-binding protein
MKPSDQPQFLIETDILAEFLFSDRSAPTVLTHTLARGRCYTTFVNAFELFRAAHSERAQAIVYDLLTMVRVLGFNSRLAQPFASAAEQVRSQQHITLSDRDAMVIGMAVTGKLSIVTTAKFQLYTSLTIDGLSVAPLVSVGTTNRPVAAKNGSQNILSRAGIVQTDDAVRQSFPLMDSIGE